MLPHLILGPFKFTEIMIGPQNIIIIFIIIVIYIVRSMTINVAHYLARTVAYIMAKYTVHCITGK
jgi:hypothetical protein